MASETVHKWNLRARSPWCAGTNSAAAIASYYQRFEVVRVIKGGGVNNVVFVDKFNRALRCLENTPMYRLGTGF